MKILKVTQDGIYFDNDLEISFKHNADCCEYNYADFMQIEEIAHKTEFDENLTFEEVDNYGFRFGSVGTPMFFIPCYSEQNGYYSSDIEIYFKSEQVLNFYCEMRNC